MDRGRRGRRATYDDSAEPWTELARVHGEARAALLLGHGLIALAAADEAQGLPSALDLRDARERLRSLDPEGNEKAFVAGLAKLHGALDARERGAFGVTLSGVALRSERLRQKQREEREEALTWAVAGVPWAKATDLRQLAKLLGVRLSAGSKGCEKRLLRFRREIENARLRSSARRGRRGLKVPSRSSFPLLDSLTPAR